MGLFEVGQVTHLPNKLNVEINGVLTAIKSVKPLCNTKVDLKTDGVGSDSMLSIKAIEDPDSTIVLPIKQMVYDLDMYVDNEVLIIRPSRGYLFDLSSKAITETHMKTAFEHIGDFQMDLIFKISEVLMNAGSLTMTETELATYNRMKEQWTAVTSITLATSTYHVDYCFNGDGVDPMPVGLKTLARELTNNYIDILVYFGYDY